MIWHANTVLFFFSFLLNPKILLNRRNKNIVMLSLKDKRWNREELQKDPTLS